MKKNKKLKIIVLVIATVTAFLTLVLIFNNPKQSQYVNTGPESIGKPTANFTGQKAQDFYDSVSSASYNAARNIVGEFLIDNEKISINSLSKNTAVVEVTNVSTEYGDNSTYITNVDFKSIDNNKTYSMKIVNYMDGSQSSHLVIENYNYDRTFGDVIN